MPPILKKKSLWIFLASFLVVAWVAQSTYRALSNKAQEDAYSLLNEGDTFPASMPLANYEGKYTQFEDYQGKVVLINFWAAWCAPCLAEMPSLYALYDRFKEKGFEILAVSMDNDLQQGLGTLTRVAGKPPFPLFKGNEQAVFNRFPIEGLPHTVVIDRQGVIRYSKPGDRNWNSTDAVKFIEGML